MNPVNRAIGKIEEIKSPEVTNFGNKEAMEPTDQQICRYQASVLGGIALSSVFAGKGIIAKTVSRTVAMTACSIGTASLIPSASRLFLTSETPKFYDLGKNAITTRVEKIQDCYETIVSSALDLRDWGKSSLMAQIENGHQLYETVVSKALNVRDWGKSSLLQQMENGHQLYNTVVSKTINFRDWGMSSLLQQMENGHKLYETVVSNTLSFRDWGRSSLMAQIETVQKFWETVFPATNDLEGTEKAQQPSESLSNDHQVENTDTKSESLTKAPIQTNLGKTKS